MNVEQLRELMFAGKLVMITPTSKTWKKVFNYCVAVRCRYTSTRKFLNEDCYLKWLKEQKNLEYYIRRQ